MSRRLRAILAAFDRQDFDEKGLIERLEDYLARSPFVPNPPRTQTVAGMPACAVQP